MSRMVNRCNITEPMKTERPQPPMMRSDVPAMPPLVETPAISRLRNPAAVIDDAA